MSEGEGWFFGKALTEYIRALKPQPLLLALVGLNVLMLLMVYYATADTRSRYNDIVLKLIETCRNAIGAI